MTERNELEQAIEARKSANAKEVERQREQAAKTANAENASEAERMRQVEEVRYQIGTMVMSFVELLRARSIEPHGVFNVVGKETWQTKRGLGPLLKGILSGNGTGNELVSEIVAVDEGWNVATYPYSSSSDSDAITTHVRPAGLAVLQNGLIVRWGGGEQRLAASAGLGIQEEFKRPEGPPFKAKALDPIADFDTIFPIEERPDAFRERIVEWGAELL